MPVLAVLGGEAGAGRLSGILELPRQTAGGRPAYPTLFDKGAVLLRSLILNHPFIDGNKRMGVACAAVFLDINGQILAATQSELVDLALEVAMGRKKDVDSIAEWLRDRSVREDAVEEAVKNDSVGELVSSLPGSAALSARPLLEVTVLEWVRT